MYSIVYSGVILYKYIGYDNKDRYEYSNFNFETFEIFKN